MNESLKKALGIIATIIMLGIVYITGKWMDLDLIEKFAPYLATALTGWIVFYAEKWFGLKMEYLNSEIIRQQVVEAIVWAEGKAIEEFKLNRFIVEGKEKARWAVSKLIQQLPNLDEPSAEKLVDDYFPQIRPTVEQMWLDLVDEMKTKLSLVKKKSK